MKKIEIENVTLIDDVEEKEARKLYNKKKKKVLLYFFIANCSMLIIFFLVLAICSGINFDMALLILLWICFFLELILILVYNLLMYPYRKLLKIAKFNDKIRHEERIRIRERQRLQKELINAQKITSIKEIYDSEKKCQ